MNRFLPKLKNEREWCNSRPYVVLKVKFKQISFSFELSLFLCSLTLTHSNSLVTHPNL